MNQHLIAALFALSSLLGGVTHAGAGPLLTVDGQLFRWVTDHPAQTVTITYALLERTFTIPTGTSNVSPGNCGSMRPFADIVRVSPTVPSTLAVEQLELAMASWAAVANLKFVRVGNVDDAKIIVGATTQTAGRASANLSYRSIRSNDRADVEISKSLGAADRDDPVIASASATPIVLAQIERAYVCLNPSVEWKVGFDGNLDVYDLKHTFVHEIGHAIGLDHPSRSGAVMSYHYDEKVDALQNSDRAAVRSLYGNKRPD